MDIFNVFIHYFFSVVVSKCVLCVSFFYFLLLDRVLVVEKLFTRFQLCAIPVFYPDGPVPSASRARTQASGTEMAFVLFCTLAIYFLKRNARLRAWQENTF